MTDQIKIVIIGNSAAGLSALRTLRARDDNCRITLISRELGPAYSLVLLPDFISGRVNQPELMLANHDTYRDLKATTLFGKIAVEIDTANQRVMLDDGSKVPYDNLVICSGASCNRINMEGSELVPMKSLRTLQDAMEIKDLLQNARKIIFVGAGLINLKLLSLLKGGPFEFTVVEMANKILFNMLDKNAASIVEERMQAFGVNLQKGTRLTRIKKRKGEKVFAVLENGHEIETDLVIFNTGISPNIDFFPFSGIRTKRGIIVDDYARTNISNVYAAGDVAEAKERISGKYANIGNWFNAVEQGKICALSILGKRQKYEGCANINVTDLFGVTLLSLGDFDGTSKGSNSITFNDPQRGRYQKVVVRDGIIIGGVFINEKRNGGIFRSLLGEEISDLKFTKIAQSKGGFLFDKIIRPSRMRRRSW
jgi:NAD(P)H-nitrite reductase large subunit